MPLIIRERLRGEDLKAYVEQPARREILAWQWNQKNIKNQRHSPLRQDQTVDFTNSLKHKRCALLQENQTVHFIKSHTHNEADQQSTEPPNKMTKTG